MKDTYIGLIVEDSSALLVGLLGILKSGNCVVPINPTFPVDRVEFIIRDCRIKTILTDKTHYSALRQLAKNSSYLEHVICIERSATAAGDVAKRYSSKKKSSQENKISSHSSIDEVAPAAGDIGSDNIGSVGSNGEGERSRLDRYDQPCYLIYTSGSTGKPKGVQITNRNLVPLLTWFHDYFKLGEHTRVLQNLSYTFDFGIFELITTLLAGGTLYFFNKKALTDFAEYVDFIGQYQINTIHTTPSFFANIAAMGEPLAPVQLLHLGGEKLTKKMVEDAALLVGEGCCIYNGYGPTETTINSNIFAMKVKEDHSIDVPESIPIGFPTANNIAYIMDAYHNLQPVGVVGEIYIGGSGVARGYLNRPELTAERFIDNASGGPPFCKKVGPKTFPEGPSGHLERTPPQVHSEPGVGARRAVPGEILSPNSDLQRIYRTGDLGRWLPDGNVEYLGRIDHQVKVRGFRIEIGEIENCLLDHEQVKEAAVIDLETEQGDRYLCAYIVPQNENSAKGEFAVGNLRESLSRALPDYMIPSYFMLMDKMPLNPNGKLNRKELPVPEVKKSESYVAPTNEIEEKLVEIWGGVLGVDRIGIDDNFFEIGGHSLKATIMTAKIGKEFAVDISLAEIFKTPSIRGIASLISAVKWVGNREKINDREVEEVIL